MLASPNQYVETIPQTCQGSLQVVSKHSNWETESAIAYSLIYPHMQEFVQSAWSLRSQLSRRERTPASTWPVVPAGDTTADGGHFWQNFGKSRLFSAVSAPIFASRIFWFQLFLASSAASQTRSQLPDPSAPQIVHFPRRNRSF